MAILQEEQDLEQALSPANPSKEQLEELMGKAEKPSKEELIAQLQDLEAQEESVEKQLEELYPGALAELDAEEQSEEAQ